MPSLLLCDHPTDTRFICRDLGIPEDCIRDRHGSTPPVMRADIPYLLGSEQPWNDQDICASLEPQGPLLTRMCMDYGGPTTLALAEIRHALQQIDRDSLTELGAASSIVHKRAERLRRSLGKYQEAVFTYHRATHGASRPGESRGAALDKVRRTGSEFNRQFAHELRTATQQLSPRYRNLASATSRVPDVIRHTRKAARLDVASRIEATRLMQLARHAKRVGQGILIVDLGLRIHDVYQDYESGADWKRRMFVEAGGFVGALAAGELATKLAASAVGVAAVTTRSGWVVLLVGGAAAAAATAATMAGDAIVQAGVGTLYDSIVESQQAKP